MAVTPSQASEEQGGASPDATPHENEQPAKAKSLMNGTTFNGASLDIGEGNELKNNPGTRKQITELQREVDKLQREKAELQSKVNERYSVVAAAGVPKEAFKRARKDAELTTEQLAQRDLAYLICRQAMGVPLELDLFMTKGELKKLADRLAAHINPAS